MMFISIDTRQWTEIFAEGEIPLARRAHLTVVYERKMYVFGGWNGTDYFDDAYYYHFSAYIPFLCLKNMKYLAKVTSREE